MVPSVFIAVASFGVASVVPFLVSVLVARSDVARGRYRLTARVCTVAATLTVIYSLVICCINAPALTVTPDELLRWLGAVGIWDLAVMFCSSAFASLGYLVGARTAKSLDGESVEAGQQLDVLPGHARTETGNPYQAP